MKKIILFISLFLLLPIINVSAKDISEYVTITSIKLYDKNGNEIDINKGNNPDDYNNGVKHAEDYGCEFTYKIDMGANVINAGDTATIPFSYEGRWRETSDISLINNGVKIGSYKNSGYKLIFTFNEKVNNISVFSGTVNITNHLHESGSYFPYDKIKTFAIGDLSVTYKKTKTTLNEIRNSFNYFSMSTPSDNALSSNIYIGQKVERYLTNPEYEELRKDSTWVNNNIFYNDVFIEQSFKNIVGISVESNYPSTMAFIPMDETDSIASNSFLTRINIKKYFTLLTQYQNETIDEFRNRIKTNDLQYGIYKENDTTYTFMMYLGNFPNEKLKVRDTGLDTLVNNSGNAFMTDARKQVWQQSHSQDNCINGMITTIIVSLDVKYLPVVSSTTREESIIFYYNGVSETKTSSNTLTPLSISTHLPIRNINLYTFDEDTNSVIPNSKFKLYRLNNDNWDEYGETYTSDENGRIEITNLPNGKYKFEQIEYADNYLENSEIYRLSNIDNIIDDEIHFEITSSDEEGYLLYVSNKKKEDSNTNNNNTNTTKDNSDVKGISTYVVNPKTGVRNLVLLIIPLVSIAILVIYKSKKRLV